MTVGINDSDRRNETEKHLEQTIDTFVSRFKKEAIKKTLIVIGASTAVVVVVVLLKKDKATTAEYLLSLEKASQLKEQYDKLFHDHLNMTEKYLDLIEVVLDIATTVEGKPKLDAVPS
jgi:hypothetical protein